MHAATRRLASQRIEVINDAKVKEVRPEAVVLSDRRTIAARTTVWAAGIEPPPLVKSLGVDKDHRGRILVDEFLRVKSTSGTYAVGDCTSIDYDGPPVPALAQAAEQEGKRAALNLVAEIKGEAPVPFGYRSLGQLVDLGEGSAVVDILGTRVSGRIGRILEGATLCVGSPPRAPALAGWRSTVRRPVPPHPPQGLRTSTVTTRRNAIGGQWIHQLQRIRTTGSPRRRPV